MMLAPQAEVPDIRRKDRRRVQLRIEAEARRIHKDSVVLRILRKQALDTSVAGRRVVGRRVVGRRVAEDTPDRLARLGTQVA